MIEEITRSGYRGIVLVDTNIFMECVHREDFISDFKDNGLEMATPIEVIEELDNLKTKDGRSGYEARKAIKFVEVLIENETLMVLSKTLNSENTESIMIHDKRAGYADYKLLDLSLKKGYPVLTNDLSLRILINSNTPVGIGKKAFSYEHTNKTKSLDSSIIHIDYRDLIIGNEVDIFTRDEFLGNPELVVNKMKINVLEGQYVSLEYFSDKANKVYIKNKNNYIPVSGRPISFPSVQFNKVRPKSNDVHQLCMFDSLMRNNLNLITGPAGSGKTYISLAYIFNQLESNQIDRVVIFVNPEETRDGAKLGYYKGDLINKLLQKSLGGILESKLGSKVFLEKMIQDEIIVLKSVADIRGYEVPANSLLYITEAQNLTVELMKLCLQRASNDIQVIVEGDPETQLDGYVYEGYNNGMIKLLETFSGEESFGHVNLDKIYRSRIAEIADKMTI